MREGKGFLLVYSIDSRNTFDEISVFKEKILRAKDMDHVPMYDELFFIIYCAHDLFLSWNRVLVGNKCDLLDDQRQVQEEEGKALAEQWGCPFMEVSAKEKVLQTNFFFFVRQRIFIICVLFM